MIEVPVDSVYVRGYSTFLVSVKIDIDDVSEAELEAITYNSSLV